jgi:hypothetical protein
MAFELLQPQPPAREPDLAWADLGPGLYAGETALQLTSDIFVAVSAEPRWQENGAGVEIIGDARWIKKDGSTKLCPSGAHVESHVSHSVSAEFLAAHPLDVVLRETLLLLIGEPVDDPAVQWSDAVKVQANIRVAIKSVKQARMPDPARLLGLVAAGPADTPPAGEAA